MNKNYIFAAHTQKTAKELILAQLVTGDIIKVKSEKFPLIYHYGVIIRNNDEFIVYHNDPFSINNKGGNIIEENALNWIKTKEIASIVSTGLKETEIKSKINEIFKEKYHFFNNNCEHFVSRINNNNLVSPQLIGYSILVSSLILALSIIIIRNEK